MIARLLYISRSEVPAGREALQIGQILAVSRRNNAALGITGLLVSAGRHFAQVLEGDAVRIESLFATIEQDPRHSNIRVIFERHDPQRRFVGWSLLIAEAPELEDVISQLLMHLSLDTTAASTFEQQFQKVAARLFR